MSNHAGILAVPSVREFFDRAVRAAIDRDERFEPNPATAGYLVDLLCEYALRPPALDQPLSILIARACSRLAPQRLRQLKRVGDHSLYVAGYFRPSLRGKVLDLDYYNTMGETAYRRLSLLLHRHQQASTLRRVYAELAGDFLRFVDVLAVVRSETDSSLTDDVVTLYETWIQSRSEALRQRLWAAGVKVGTSPPEEDTN